MESRISCGRSRASGSSGQAALNLIKQEKTVKVGMKTKRKMCGWDHNYMMLVLSGDPTRSS